MRSALRTKLYLLPAALLLSSAAFATDIQIDGSCVQGTCPPSGGPTDALSFGQTSSGPSRQALTIGSDTYLVSWTYNDTYTGSGTTISVTPTVTYTGALPTASADTITFNLFEDYYNTSPGTWNGTYGETIAFNLSAGVTASGQLLYDGQGLGVVSQVGPGSTSNSNAASLTGLTGNDLVAKYAFTFNFAQGDPNGAFANSPNASGVPEPAQFLPVGLALLGLACYQVVVRRRSISTN